MALAKIIVEYDGTYYHGMHKILNNNVQTIQSVIESNLQNVFDGTDVKIDFCGRTDTGVHAIGQVCHFRVPEKYERIFMDNPNKLALAINFYLIKFREGITILSCSFENDDFHSRFSCKSRIYQYKILNRLSDSILLKNRAWHVPYNLNMELIIREAQFLIGTNDLSSFRRAGCTAKSPIRTIDRIDILKDGDIITIEIEAQSFLYGMVRNIVGTLVDIGRGKNYSIVEVLESKNRINAGMSAPAYGLYFYKAVY